MRGLGTIINALAILAGGVLGILCKSFLQERYQDTIIKVANLLPSLLVAVAMALV